MAVLEPAELRIRQADKALVICRDKSVTKFDQLLRAQQVKPATRSTYLWMLTRLKRQAKTQTDLIDLTETELMQAMSEVADKAKGSGFQTFARAVKRFYTVMGREDLAKKIRVPRRSSKMPEILTADQIRGLIESAGGPDGSIRDRLIVELLWESAARIGELCALRIKDVQFEQHAAALFLNGKTGQRRVLVFASKPDLMEYVNGHPFRNNPNEYLFLSSLGTAGHFHKLTEFGVRGLLAKLGKRVLNRRVHPHMFRHTRATELSRHLTDRELKIYGGWKRTNMLEVYSHLSGKDVDDKLLALHGFKSQEADAPTLAIRICRQAECKAENSPMAIYCQKCGHPLASDSAEDLLRDPKFISGLAQNQEFLTLLKKALH